nr:MAG TPA: hypothetical protein [Caudoviricetes sp.]
MSGPGGPQSTWPVDPWCDLWKPLHMEVQRLLGMGWQWKRSKWDFSPMGRPSTGSPLGGLPRATASTPCYLTFTLYLPWPTGTTDPYHFSPLTYAPTSTTHLYHLYHLYYPGAKCLRKFVGQKRNVLRRLICGTWTTPKLGGVTHWRKSLELLEHTLYAPTAPLFGIVPSTRSQPLPEWPGL